MWVTCNGLAQIVGSLLMYGIGTSTLITIAPWRAMFIIAGSITVAAGLLFFSLMPANIDTAWFLTPEERIVASKRLAGQHDGGDKLDFSMKQFKEALLDVRTFITFLFGLLVTINSIVLTVSEAFSFG
jgi:MFS family permease